MREFIVCMVLIFCVVGCGRDAETASRAGRGFVVERLFVHEGCTVYRFSDYGRPHYFTNCKGSTISGNLENCGKNCTTIRDEEIQTR